MTYRIDPDLESHTGGKRPCSKCTDKARDLLECLDVSSCGAKVKSVRVKRVSLDIDLGGSDCC